MGKKLILVLIALLTVGFIVMQSCNESPMMTSEPTGQQDPNNGLYLNNGMVVPRVFAGINNGLPKKCPELTGKLELWSGIDIYTGYIEFYTTNTPGKIKVRYNFECDPCESEYPWAVEYINFHIGDKLVDIPTYTDGYPKISEFLINVHFTPAFTGDYYEFEYTLPPDTDQDGYYIAGYSRICVYGGTQGFNFYLPDSIVKYQVNYNSPSSYFKVNFLDGTGGMLGTGTYEGFCIDADLNIYPPATLTGHIYSSYEALNPALQTAIEHSDNLDLVNWIINNFSVGGTVPKYNYSIPWTTAEWPFPLANFTPVGSNGTITWEDIQAAIWGLIEDDPVYNAWRYLPNLTKENAWGIIYAALTTPGADGFVPGCNQKITAILVPDEGNIQIITIQPTIIQLEIPCYTCCNDGWADGKFGSNFPGTYWATYFRWNYNCPTK